MKEKTKNKIAKYLKWFTKGVGAAWFILTVCGMVVIGLYLYQNGYDKTVELQGWVLAFGIAQFCIHSFICSFLIFGDYDFKCLFKKPVKR